MKKIERLLPLGMARLLQQRWMAAGVLLTLNLISGWGAGLSSSSLLTTQIETPGAGWQSTPGGRWRALPEAPPGQAGFLRIPGALTGVLFSNTLPAAVYLTNFLYLNGSGVALGDTDGDGWCDIFLGGIGGRSALYRNRGGWKFEDVTVQAGVQLAGLAVTGAAFVDLDGDSHPDLVVNTMGQGTRVLFNDGSGTFTEGAVLNPGRAGMSLAFADFDGNGTLDFYIANYRTESIRDHPNTRFQISSVQGRQVITKVDGRSTTEPDLTGRFTLSPSGQIIEQGEPDALYQNAGDRRYLPVSFTDGSFIDDEGKPLSSPPRDWGLSVIARDLNGDGLPDLYVCNDFESADRIWLNTGSGQFRALDKLALRHTSIFSMGIDVGDLNRDGFDDLLVSDMLMQTHASRHLRIGELPPVFARAGVLDDRPQYSFNTLQLSRGDGTFAEMAWQAGLEASGWTWCPVLLDVDLDGYEDVLFSTGHQWDMMNADVIRKAESLKAQRKMSAAELSRLRMMFQRFDTPNAAFRNRGDLTFQDMSKDWGFTDGEVSQGVALADLDKDGDLDVVMNNLNGQASLYRNEGTAPRLAVRLKGLAPNTRGIGARILLRGGAVPLQSQEMVAGGRYLSCDDSMRVFAAGAVTREMELEVQWRSGQRSLLAEVRANRLYEVEEAAASRTAALPRLGLAPAEAAGQWFEDVSNRLNHSHHEEDFDDFVRQPLLPRKLSQLGPGVCWCDWNGDGFDDLAIGGARGGTLSVFYNDGHGGFSAAKNAFLNGKLARDLTTVLGAEGVLLAGSSNYEDGLTNGGCVRIYDFQRRASGESVLGQGQSAGPLALADIDGDGDLDLFIGGRVVPGRYPEPADSLLLRNEEGRFVIGRRFEKLGLISGAVFSDLDGDGMPELVLACEWGPVRVFGNRGGDFIEITESMGLGSYLGWWNSVTTGDFDGDGRMDIAAGNWGTNHRSRATPEHPKHLYFADFDQDGVLDLIEAADSPETGVEVPDRGLRLVGSALPWVLAKAGSYEAYSNASLIEIYGPALRNAGRLGITSLGSAIFLNRGDHFEMRELPAEAQRAPVFGISAADLDGDGEVDLFVAQNFFDVPPDEVRLDAGRGLWLRGEGAGDFRPVPGQESGLAVYGEQRGCAIADYDGDGRIDLVVTQNGNRTVLYHNRLAQPGLRIRLRGHSGNQAAIGAGLRSRSRQGPWGAAREIHAGSGYWSQDSAAAIVPKVADQEIQVRWPGGKATVSSVPKEAREIVIEQAGSVRVVH